MRLKFNQFFYLFENLKIVAPALKVVKTGEIIAGKPGDIHASVLETLVEREAKKRKTLMTMVRNKIYDMLGTEIITGFIDNKGDFHDRKEAHAIAKGTYGFLRSETL